MIKKPPIVINLFAGPGCGKSTTAAMLFSKLKLMEINCELVNEYAKSLTWEKATHKLQNQIYVFSKQHHRMWRVKDDVDIIITDSPLLLSCIYGKDWDHYFKNLVFSEHSKYNNINVVLNRVKKYNKTGRNQTLDEAKLIDSQVKNLLLTHSEKIHLTLDGNATAADSIIEYLQQNQHI